MDITPENLVYHELIGLPVRVETAPYRAAGVVVDETRNLLVIGTEGHAIRSPKRAAPSCSRYPTAGA